MVSTSHDAFDEHPRKYQVVMLPVSNSSRNPENVLRACFPGDMCDTLILFTWSSYRLSHP